MSQPQEGNPMGDDSSVSSYEGGNFDGEKVFTGSRPSYLIVSSESDLGSTASDGLNNGSQNSSGGKSVIRVSSDDSLVACNERIPLSDSNKENVDGNNLPKNDTCEQSSFFESAFGGEYDNTDQIPLPELLEIHSKQLVSGFEFGEATKRRAQENMKSARDRNHESRRSAELTSVYQHEEDVDFNKPCCSKQLQEHKTPHSRKRPRVVSTTMPASSEREFPKASRRAPDCIRDSPNCVEVWDFMISKEEALMKLRNPRLFYDFNSVTPRMRAILLDWLMEVSSVYHLRRVTYYLSVDYFDRFLSIRPDIPKSLLQLVGITCLYIAAKIEEIYPPNLNEFSYVCDGACQSREMISCEVLILNSLGWEVLVTTPSDWLNLYMQLHHKGDEATRCGLIDFNKDFVFPQYSSYQFTRASQLMDVLSLDADFLKFSYSIIAAAAMYYMYGCEVALSVSGLDWSQLKPCVDYMEAVNFVIQSAPDPRLYSVLGGSNVEETTNATAAFQRRLQSGPQSECYAFQIHIASIEYFEKAAIYRLSKVKHDDSNDTLSDNTSHEDEDDELDNGNSKQKLSTLEHYQSRDDETTERLAPSTAHHHFHKTDDDDEGSKFKRLDSKLNDEELAGLTNLGMSEGESSQKLWNLGEQDDEASEFDKFLEAELQKELDFMMNLTQQESNRMHETNESKIIDLKQKESSESIQNLWPLEEKKNRDDKSNENKVFDLTQKESSELIQILWPLEDKKYKDDKTNECNIVDLTQHGSSESSQNSSTLEHKEKIDNETNENKITDLTQSMLSKSMQTISTLKDDENKDNERNEIKIIDLTQSMSSESIQTLSTLEDEENKENRTSEIEIIQSTQNENIAYLMSLPSTSHKLHGESTSSQEALTVDEILDYILNDDMDVNSN